MRKLENIQPERVFRYFEEICGIPHGSGNTDEISAYIASFASEHGLRYVKDEMNNCIIWMDASPGYEEAAPVILQGHMDMVCEKRPDLEHDFEKDGLNISVENGYITANGTTLGGDDGIAVAMMLALLSDPSIPHPALECVFTVDEEIGLLGAAALDTSVLSGKRMINLDSEAEGILWIACAGGSCLKSSLPVKRTTQSGVLLQIDLDGLLGGHSGGEIDKIRMNADHMMARYLSELKEEAEFGLVSLAGGLKDNAIPRSASCRICVSEEEVAAAEKTAERLQKDLRTEYAGSDPGATLRVTRLEEGEYAVLHPTSREKVLFFLRNLPFGIQKMSGTIPGLVETSLNLGILSLEEDRLYAENSVRSSVGSAKKDLQSQVIYLTEFLGGECEVTGDYPAWEYREESPLRDRMASVFRSMYQKEPQILAIHAGLECGLFYDRIEGLDCVSIGPDMSDIHTSEEHLAIDSTERVWKYLLEVLKELKD